MDKKRYLPRIVDSLLLENLEAMGAVLIEGPKWCGKTWTGEYHSASALKLQDVDNAEKYALAIAAKPSILLKGKTPRLIDEWQDQPVLWNAVRCAVDDRGLPGQFILTGSAVPRVKDRKEERNKLHTGTGRFAWLKMRPMSLFESGESNGTVSMKELFGGHCSEMSSSSLSLDDIAHLICRGGWPQSVRAKTRRASYIQAANYVEAVINSDVKRADGFVRNKDRTRRVLQSLSRNISTLATFETILGDVKSNDFTMSEKTLTAYIKALRDIFLVEDEPAWAPPMRAKLSMRVAAKRQFVDPSIAAAALNATPDRLMKDFRAFGFLFESLCVRDVRIYSQPLDGEVRHYRDQTGLEVDMIVVLKDGRWGGIEVKLGAGQIDEAAENLKKMRAKLDFNKMGQPSFLMVLTGIDMCYTRTDGVIVCPIGCLRP